MDYEFTIAEELQHNFTALSNNTFQPYMADIGDPRMIGCQIAQSKPNVPMWCALLRGAAKQHGPALLGVSQPLQSLGLERPK